MGWVDAPTEAEEAEAGEGCPGSFETHGKVVDYVYLQILRAASSPSQEPATGPQWLESLATSSACLQMLAKP